MSSGEELDPTLPSPALVTSETEGDGSIDPGPVDTGPVDTGPVDTGPVDTGPVDTGPVDTGPVDEAPGLDLAVDVEQEVESSTGRTPPTLYCPLHLERVEVLLPATNAQMVLRETDGPRRYLVIPIGLPEANAIAIASQGLQMPRPLTHDLFTETLRAFGISMEAVRITAASDGSFRAEIVLSGSLGSRVLDCRPSDGVALALRQVLSVPITAAAVVLDQLGVDTSG